LALNRCPANGYDGYRNYRQVVNFAPSDYSRWYYFNAGDGFYRSTDRARTWSKVSSQPTSMGRCWYVQVDPNNADLIWAACDTGLWKSVNGGAVWNKAQANLPGGLLTSLNMNAENGDDFYVVVLGVGLYRTENGGGRFSKVQTLHDNICQVAVSPVNRNHIWVTGVDKLPSGAQVSGNSMYSSNGGARWTTITHDSGTYGWDWPRWQDKFRATGNTTVSLQNVILPSPNTATRAIATNYCAMWRTNNGVHFENASDGYDNLASGEANLSNWGWSKTNPNVVYCAQFDYRLYLSRDNYDSFTSGNVVSGGTSDSHVMASVSVNPEDPDYLLMTNGYYTSPRTVLISKDGGRSASNSFRPSFFAANSGLGIQQYWAEWHPSIGRFAFAQSGMSSDWGTTWENWISRDRSGVFNASGPGSTAAAAGVIGVSPSNGSVLWAINASGNTLYRTTDMGRNWTAIVNGTGLTVWGNIPISFCPDPLDADACYWWDAGVGLKRWKAGRGVTVTAAELSSMRVDRIRVSPLDANHIYLMCRENGASMIYRSVTGPEGPWEDITGNLPRVISNRSIEIDPHTGIVFCVGTIGTRMFPPPGGHPRFNELAKRFGR
jgi:hypothetical protein